MKFLNLFLIFLFLTSCNRIESNETLSKTDLQRLKEIKLLDNDEKVIQFYSEYKNNVAGNFFTNRRIAHYWLDKRDALKNKIEFAYYKDVIKIEPFFQVGLTYCPYVLVTKSNNETFKVCIDGTEKEKEHFLNEAISIWKTNLKTKNN